MSVVVVVHKLPSLSDFGYCFMFDVHLRSDILLDALVAGLFGTGKLRILLRRAIWAVENSLHRVHCGNFYHGRLRRAQHVLVVAFFGVCLLLFQ